MDQLLQTLQQPETLMALAVAYGLGSIPFGLVITKFFLGFDVRQQGSGNIGMTNVMRTAGKWPGIATFLLDFFKGTLAVYLAYEAFGQFIEILVLAGFFAVLGHTKSIFLKFTGGKGVATNFGIWLYLDWRIFVVTAGIWALLFALKRISSLSALMALVALPVSGFYWHGLQELFWLSLVLSVYLIFLHRSNIQRLLSGQEGKLKAKS